VQRKGRIPVAGLIGPKVGESLKIGFDHDEPSKIVKVQCMVRYCKKCSAMSRISELDHDQRNCSSVRNGSNFVQLINNVTYIGPLAFWDTWQFSDHSWIAATISRQYRHLSVLKAYLPIGSLSEGGSMPGTLNRADIITSIQTINGYFLKKSKEIVEPCWKLPNPLSDQARMS